MSDRYIERKQPSSNSKWPISPNEQAKWQRIRIVLVKYVVKGTDEEIDHVAHELWRASRDGSR